MGAGLFRDQRSVIWGLAATSVAGIAILLGTRCTSSRLENGRQSYIAEGANFTCKDVPPPEAARQKESEREQEQMRTSRAANLEGQEAANAAIANEAAGIKAAEEALQNLQQGFVEKAAATSGEAVSGIDSSSSRAVESASPATYSAAHMLQIAQSVERTSSGDIGLQSRHVDASGAVARESPANMVVDPDNRPNGTVYCDLDGVLCDFEGGVAAALKRPFDELTSRKDKDWMWQSISKTREFYTKLPWLSEGRKLWEGLQSFSPTILSGVPENWGAAASTQKRKWVRRELGQQVPILTCLKSDKWQACRKGDILIDDDDNHRQKWEENGGIFVHHTGDSAASLSTLAQLQVGAPDARFVEVKWEGDWWWCKTFSDNSGSTTEVEFMEPPHSGYRYHCPLSSLRRQRPNQ